ncbi:UNVERIFIED_CONTAM: hypothetical protein Scaly_1216200 [Sesamum calycinum]|uniref:Uncharacterized protein n=1 Tax=Sesamum calycinum TaxID=2727403 RepID=A0AAW2Q4V4_9LAMI
MKLKFPTAQRLPFLSKNYHSSLPLRAVNGCIVEFGGQMEAVDAEGHCVVCMHFRPSDRSMCGSSIEEEEKRKCASRTMQGDGSSDGASRLPGWRSVIMKVLMGSARWSRGSKWEESLRDSWRETPRPLLVKRDVGGADGGRQSHNSTSAVWQRPILMGEKCELPRFSGLILYDQRGMPVHQCEDGIMHDQEKPPAVMRTTLRDLL